MHQSKLSIYICMLLDRSGQPMTTEVIETATLPNAIERAMELMQCCALPKQACGYELWNRGRKLATWQDLDLGGVNAALKAANPRNSSRMN